MLDLVYWLPIVMHVAVGVVSLVAFMALFYPSILPSSMFSEPDPHKKKPNKNKKMTSRAQAKIQKENFEQEQPEYVYGLINNGNTCFLNSILQALATSTYLKLFLETSPIVTRCLGELSLNLDEEDFPVTSSLYNTLNILTKLVSKPTSAYPSEIINSLREKMRITTYEQQDAQEFFQVLSDALNEEEMAVVQGCRRLSLLDPDVIQSLIWENSANKSIAMFSLNSHDSAPNGRRNPLNGLLASRLSCVQCGYTAAVRHFAFNNISLSLPFRSSCTLEECLQSYITIESLQDVNCRKCSIRATIAKLEQGKALALNNIKRKQPIKTKFKSAPKALKKDSDCESTIKKLVTALEFDIEHDLGPEIKLEKVVSHHTTKQVMFAKPPSVLCLHLNRSAYFPNGAISKNTCQVRFKEILDLSPFCTTGHLMLGPQSPLSTPDSPESVSQLYRLQAVVVHYGSHSYGHFVTLRRKPIPDHAQPKLSKENAKDFASFFNSSSEEWFQVSDQSVYNADILDVLSSNPYMLVYEKIDPLALSKDKDPTALEEMVTQKNLDSNTNYVDHLSLDEKEELVLVQPSPSSTFSSGPPTPAEDVSDSDNFLVASDGSLPLSSSFPLISRQPTNLLSESSASS